MNVFVAINEYNDIHGVFASKGLAVSSIINTWVREDYEGKDLEDILMLSEDEILELYSLEVHEYYVITS